MQVWIDTIKTGQISGISHQQGQHGEQTVLNSRNKTLNRSDTLFPSLLLVLLSVFFFFFFSSLFSVLDIIHFKTVIFLKTENRSFRKFAAVYYSIGKVCSFIVCNNIIDIPMFSSMTSKWRWAIFSPRAKDNFMFRSHVTGSSLGGKWSFAGEHENISRSFWLSSYMADFFSFFKLFSDIWINNWWATRLRRLSMTTKK